MSAKTRSQPTQNMCSRKQNTARHFQQIRLTNRPPEARQNCSTWNIPKCSTQNNKSASSQYAGGACGNDGYGFIGAPIPLGFGPNSFGPGWLSMQ